ERQRVTFKHDDNLIRFLPGPGKQRCNGCRCQLQLAGDRFSGTSHFFQHDHLSLTEAEPLGTTDLYAHRAASSRVAVVQMLSTGYPQLWTNLVQTNDVFITGLVQFASVQKNPPPPL